ncbi:calmodulin-like protein 6 [Rousettus aegyptiacus]|uniref:calmodulin-like protein 6 n=1 Tax=Rousettus aegyptiacus TaxID=9407 RepID=UPI00168D0DC6|nr:calmodulin-like protein 6 [Rousettus aegyptiacus]
MTPTHTPHCSHGLACALACASHLACLEGLPWETCMSRTAHRAERLTAQQVKEYKGVFEMFDEEGNGEVKTGELERLMSLLGINPTKSELASMAKDVDRDNKGFFNCSSFLALMGVYWEKAQNQEGELRAAFRVFDKEGKGYIDWDTLKYVLMNAGEPLNEVEAEQMMKEADKDGDGTIDYEEFVAMMTGESFKLVQ